MIPISETERGVVFQIQVLPRSSRQEIAGFQGDFLKIRLNAPPLEGRANEECIRFLADRLGVKRTQVTITGGLKSRRKTVSITGLKKKELEALLAGCISP